MIAWEHLDQTTVPGGGELRLIRRGAEYAIMLGRDELMNSRRGASETALGTLSCRRIAGRTQAHVLVGGLGMGFTLRAAQAGLGSDARIIVAELVPAVVHWARGPMSEIFGDSLADPRLDIRAADVGELIHAGRSSFDAILLDVDNGPDGLTRKGNDRLYSAEGLGLARNALRSGGVLAIWSAEPDARFAVRLARAGFDVDEVRVHASGKGRGVRHLIWFATRPP